MTRPFLCCLAALILAAACSPKHTQDLREKTVTLSCAQPAFLQAGDKIALLSPSAGPTQGGRTITEGKKQRKLVRVFDFLRHFEGIRR